MVDYITELFVDGQWTAITSDVRDSEPIKMMHGREDWASTTDPSTCTLKLNNGASKVAPGQFGRYSPRNPRSDLYGKARRNTPIRVRRTVRANDSLWLPGLDGAFLDSPDAAAFDITGDLDVRIDLAPDTWGTFNGARTLISRWRFPLAANERSWVLYLNNSGLPRLAWTTDGTDATRVTGFGTTGLSLFTGRLALRATLDVDNGAGGWTVTYYTAPTISGPWTQLGTPVVTPGITSVYAGSTPLAVGATADGVAAFDGSRMITATVYAAEVRSGIGGTVVANPLFAGYEPEDRTLTDTAGRTWTLRGAATFRDPAIRFTGEAASWPAKWDLSGADQWVNLTAAGITRRLQQGKKPLKSSLFRDLSVRSNVVYYIPMEEPDGAVRFTSGRAGDTSFLEPSNLAAVNVAASEVFAASAPLPTLGAADISGRIPSYPSATAQRFVFLAAIPAAGISTDRHLARFSTAGTMGRWELIYAAGGGARMRAYDNEGVLFFDHGPIATTFNGELNMHSLWLEQQGSSVFFQWAVFPVGSGGAFIVDEGTASKTFGRFTSVQLGTTVGMEGTTFGHLALLNGDVHSIWDVAGNSLVAWAGESGAERLDRLGSDEGLPPLRLTGGGGDVEAMGPQRLLTLMSLLREVPTADLGMLTDAPDAVALQYRARTDLYNQEPALVLDYTTGVISEPFVPVDDDRYTRNSIEVTRVRGSSFTAAQESGPMSVQDPPAGVGKYDISQELNIDADGRLADQAFWRLHLGTIDEARWPKLRIDLRNERAALLIDDVLAVRVGDIIRITNPPAWLPGGPYDLLVEGWTEEKSAATHYIEFTCSPGSAWKVAVAVADTDVVAPDAPSRADTAGSQLAAAVTATAQTLSLATTSGPLWTTAPNALYLEGIEADYLSTPHRASFNVADLDLRVDLHPTTWRPAAAVAIARKYVAVTGGRSWVLWLDPAGTLVLRWSADGAAFLQTTSTAVPITSGRLAVRITIDVDNGAGGRVVTWYTAPTIAGPWTVLGSASTTAGTTAIHPSNSPIEVGRSLPGGVTLAYFTGRVHAFQLRTGIGGSVVANAVLDAVAAGAASFTDSLGNVWSTNGGDVVGDFPFDLALGGEVVRVQTISGTTSPQTATVTRAVNGVEKAHTAGTAVSLAHPARCAL